MELTDQAVVFPIVLLVIALLNALEERTRERESERHKQARAAAEFIDDIVSKYPDSFSEGQPVPPKYRFRRWWVWLQSRWDDFMLALSEEWEPHGGDDFHYVAFYGPCICVPAIHLLAWRYMSPWWIVAGVVWIAAPTLWNLTIASWAYRYSFGEGENGSEEPQP